MGLNGQAKWNAIRGHKPLVENYRSYDIDRIKGIKVVQYHFTDPTFKVNFNAGPGEDPNKKAAPEEGKEGNEGKEGPPTPNVEG